MAPHTLRVGAAGFLLLLTLVAPAFLARHESGQRLFLPAQGRPVLAWGAWRTAWMAGYFYNDGRIEEASGLQEIRQAIEGGSTLVLCGPGERRQMEALPDLELVELASGPRATSLLRVRRRPS